MLSLWALISAVLPAVLPVYPGKDPDRKISPEDVQGSEMNHSRGKKKDFCHWFYMLSGFGVCRRPTMSDYLVLCFASLESVKVLVLHTAVPKGSGESDQSQEVNDRKKLYESSGSIFFFIQFFPMVFRKWSSCWGVLASETRVFFCWVPLQMYVFLCQLRSFSFLLGMVIAWFFFIT